MEYVRNEEVIICNNQRRGDGNSKLDPVRIVLQVYKKDGTLLAENDPVNTMYTPMDMVHFANYCINKKINIPAPTHVESWLDSI